MPNRIIKESVCTSAQIDELSPFEEVFFYRLLVNCDDYGCMDAREKVLRAKLFPLKSVRPSDIDKAVIKLASVGLIAMYEVNEGQYLKVIKWADHQRVRISKHKYPEPTEEQIEESLRVSRQLAASCGELRRVAENCGELRPESNPIQSNTNPNTNTNPNPKENTRKPRAEALGPLTQERFDQFWDEYPNKKAKQDALKAWGKILPDGVLFGKIMDGLRRWKDSADWKDDGGRFIPYPASWLNGKRWEDEITERPVRETKTVKLPAQNYEQRDYSDEQEAAMDRLMNWYENRGNA